jgi:hypothetical protein
MKNVDAAALAFLFFAANVSADPSPEINYLIREPATMLDLGLYKLQGSIDEIVDYNLTNIGIKPPVSVNAIYDFARNQIHVMLFVAQTVPDAKVTCGRLVTTVQTWMNSTTVWAEDFTHSGYTGHEQADAAMKAKLPSLIVIDATVTSDLVQNLPAMRTASASCSGTLSTPGVTYTGP